MIVYANFAALCFIGIILPALVTGIAYAVGSLILSIFHKQFSKRSRLMFLVSVFWVAMLVAIYSVIYEVFKNGIPPLD